MRRILYAAATVAVALGVSTAWGSIPAPDGTISGCYGGDATKDGVKYGQGSLRVIDPALATCKENETAISWSQTGPAGPAGAQGPSGSNGEPGAAGPAGADSTIPGPQGPVGPAGPQGVQGPIGIGVAGPAGLQGESGSQGAVGPAGPQGGTGPAGASGVSGYVIVQGPFFGWSNIWTTKTVLCPSGKKVLGGGFVWSGGGGTNGLLHNTDGPTPDGSGWQIQGMASSTLQGNLYAICASV